MRKTEMTDTVSFSQTGGGGLTTESWEFSLLTPMFGGDTESWEPNTQRPVRESSVKGHLRFWWRTMQDIPDPKKLRERENEIFGATGAASKVGLSIRFHSVDFYGNLTVHPRDGVRNGGTQINNFPIYALFPLIPRGNGSVCITKCDFTLTVSMNGLDEEQVQSVRNAVKLWVLFGGVGARTRRGCGSIYCGEVMKEFSDETSIKAFMDKLVAGQKAQGQPPNYPQLTGARLAVKKFAGNDGCTAWNDLIERYQKFRQSRNPGTQPNRPGRSHWPEPDAIRRITDQYADNHAPVHPAGDWFPRAAYGMPVQIEFRNAAGDPSGKFFVQPVKKERWTSPVVFRVLKLANGSLLQLCLILSQAIPKELELKGSKTERLEPKDHPDDYKGRLTLSKDSDTLDESPYDTLIRKLNLTEVK